MSDKKHAGISIEGGKRLALVVGVNSAPKSRLSLLKFARQDAEDVADVLQKYCNFTLVNDKPFLEEQATSTVIKATILDLLEQVEANDFLLFYFSGHGQPIDVEADRKEVYLGTYDFVEKQVERDENLHLSLKWLRDKLYQQMEAGKVLLVLDCCYGGNIWRGGPDPYLKELYDRLKYYFGEPGATTGASHKGLRLALTATGQNLPTREEQAHGRMTGFLLPILRGEKPEAIGKGQQLTVLRLVDYLQSNYEQPPLPTLSGDACQECVLATFAASQSEVTLPKVVSADRPQNYLPIKRNPHFQPRPGEFEQLERIIFASGTPKSGSLGLVGVTGMGGVGKTQLAAELAYRYQQHFPGGIFWMPATGQSLFDWQHTLADLAVKTSYFPPDDDSAKPEHEALRARHLCRYFAAHADVLVILDNVEVSQLVTTALADLAGGELACTVLYTSRQRMPLAGVALYSVEVLSEEGGLRLLLESTRPILLEEVQAGGTSTEAEAARRVYRITGALPLALTLLQSLLLRDRKLSLSTLATILQERGVLTLPGVGRQQETLAETFQLSLQQVRDERARRFFLLASLFPEAIPIPLWLAGLAAGLGERTQPFDPLWEIRLSLQELSLLEGLTDDQVRLHPLVREFGQQILQQEKEQGSVLRAEAGSRLVDAFNDLTLLEQRARRTNFHNCLEQLRAARDYALLLDTPCANQLNRLERWLDRESYLLADERWWPETIPGLFYQQFFNLGVETGKPMRSQESPSCWLKQVGVVGVKNPALLRTFGGHTDEVTSVAFSPDGRQVLAGSEDQTARIWETSSGRLLVALQGHTKAVASVAFSPDGRLILTGSHDRTACIWEASSGRLLVTLQVELVASVAWSPDGQQVLTGSWDHMACIWEASSGRLLATLQGHTKVVSSVAFSPDGHLILTGSHDGTACIWEASSGRLLVTLQGHSDAVRAEDWSLDALYAVAFSPDGQQVLTGSRDHMARLWEASSGRLLATLQGHAYVVASVAFSPDGHLILTGSYDRTVRRWEASSGHLLATLQGHSDWVESVAFSPDGLQILSGSKDRTARLWETNSVLAALHNHTGMVEWATYSPDGSQIFTTSEDQTANIWEVSSGRLLATLQDYPGEMARTAFSPDGSQIFTWSDFRVPQLWETSSGRLLAALHYTEGVASMAFSPDGRQILTGSEGVTSMAFSPDGRQILTGSFDQTARLWETSSGRLLATLRGHTKTVASVAFSSDGQQVLTGSNDERVRLWETSSGRILATFSVESVAFSAVESMAFSPDGRRILTGSYDGAVRLWEASSGRILATWRGHTNSVKIVAFSPDGRIAVTCDNNGWAFFWHVSEPLRVHPLGLYITAFPIDAVFWQDVAYLLIAADGCKRGCHYIYRLSLEGLGWHKSVPQSTNFTNPQSLTSSIQTEGVANKLAEIRKPDGDRFDKLTEQTKIALALAIEEARRFQHNYIGTEHLLLGLVREGEGIAAKVLANLGIDLNKVRSAIEFVIGRDDGCGLDEIGLTSHAKKVIELAIEEAHLLNYHYIGTEHLLLGLVHEDEGIAASILERLGTNGQMVRTQTMLFLGQSS